MLSKTILQCFAIAMTAVLSLAGPAAGDFKSLIARVPNDANALVVIDVGAVLNSPLGVKENWKAKMADAYAQKPLIIPPDATRVVMAALVNPADMESIWEVSVMELSKAPSLDLMARAEEGYLDKLGQAPAVWSPVNAYFIQLDSLVLGVACPADRQFAARWAARKPGLSGSSLSTYLAGAAAKVGADSPIVMALDLQDVTCATKVRRRLTTETFESLEGKNADLDALSQLVGGIRGVSLSVALGQEATGNGVVDFERDTAVLAKFAKPLLLELLAQMGAAIPDFEKFQVSAQGKQVSFKGKLSTEGLQRLLSVVQPPSPDTGSQAGSSGADPAAAASQKYYAAVREILQKLDKQTQGGRVGPLAQVAVWLKRDAGAISRLPLVNVDSDLARFAAEVSVRLNEASRVMSEGALQTQARTAAIRTGNVDTERRTAVAEERAKAVTQAGEIFNGIKADAERVRIAMTDRYKVEF